MSAGNQYEGTDLSTGSQTPEGVTSPMVEAGDNGSGTGSQNDNG
jgi:hypothetical protein